jgi:hypothetical protein
MYAGCREPTSVARTLIGVATTFWPNAEHWSCEIPLDTLHPRLAVLRERGWVQLQDLPITVPESEYLGLEYMDWKSGGDTNFAPIATADGQLDCRGFWNKGDERPDKGARFTTNAATCPTLVREVESVGADFGRVRVIKLEPQDHDTAFRSFHRDDNNRFNPDRDGWVVRTWLELTDFPESYMLLMDTGADGLPDPTTEVHAAPVARRRAQRQRAALCVDHELRERTRARRVGRVTTSLTSFLKPARLRARR